MAHSYIRTHMGHKFDFNDLESNVIDIKDIAWALSMTCRYGGHCSKFYSVAEHSVHVSNAVPTYKFEALMHDAAEAYIGDVVTALKRKLVAFTDLEYKVESLIAARFGLRHPWPSEVHDYDLRLLATEMPVLFGNNRDVQYAPVNISIECLQPLDAYELFLKKFNELKNGPIIKTNYGELFNKEREFAKA
jgi:5'-deoxynucleotidase YfbR-like HD superfamily hydrolase